MSPSRGSPRSSTDSRAFTPPTTARDVMAFLGRKLSGIFLGDLVTDQVDFAQLPRRPPGRRVKHRMKRNWIKMYDKEGSVLQMTRLLRRLHAHGLIAKIPHSRRWRVSLCGRRTMATALKLREVAYPSLYADAA